MSIRCLWLVIVLLLLSSCGRKLSLGGGSGDPNSSTGIPSNAKLEKWSVNTLSQLLFDPNQISLENGTLKLKSTDQRDEDNSMNGFGGGSFSTTKWDATALTLESLQPAIAGCGTGCFTSRLMDAGGVAPWTTLSWVPERPMGKEAPNNGATESGYTSGAVNMTGNVFLFHLNEAAGATTFKDSSGNAIDGTCLDDDCPTARANVSILGGSQDFNGTQTINLGANPQLNTLTGNLTIMAWVKPASVSDEIMRIAGHNGGGGTGGFAFGLRYNNLHFVSYTVRDYSVSNLNLMTNQWYHIAAVFDSSFDVSYYINGRFVSKIIDSRPIISAGNRNFYLGNGSTSGNYKGNIDEVMLFSRELSADEIKDHFLRGALKAQFQVRSCAVPCTNEPFVGPDGTAGAYFSEVNATNTGVPTSAINIANNRYFQYKLFLWTSANATEPFPRIREVKVGPDHYFAGSPSFSNVLGTPFFTLSQFVERRPSFTGNIKYQLSRDGITWHYHNGSRWAEVNGSGQMNTANEINSRIQTFHSEVGTGKFFFRGFLESPLGTQPVEWQEIEVQGLR